MIGIDLFSGAGGMSLGAAWAGIRVRFAIEASQHACRTYAYNHSDVTVINRPIETITASDFRGISRKEAVVVFGGPPCQGFSTSNQRNRNVTNPKN
jgi:DNA (cytosine-5)-methyltransferase 1